MNTTTARFIEESNVLFQPAFSKYPSQTLLLVEGEGYYQVWGVETDTPAAHLNTPELNNPGKRKKITSKKKITQLVEIAKSALTKG